MPQTPAWALVGGSAWHAATEAIDMAEMTGDGTSPTPSFAQFFLEEIDDVVTLSGVTPDQWRVSGRATKEWPDKENREWWLRHGQEWLNVYATFKRHSPWQTWVAPDGLPAVEMELEWHVGDIPVKGFVDRIWEHMVTGDLLIVDLKTGSRMVESPAQLLTYRNGLRQLWRANDWDMVCEPPRWGAYFMARQGLLTQPVDLAALDDGRLEHDYAAVARGIEAQVFVPARGQQCHWCNVADYCRAVSGKWAESELPYAVLAD